jgi:hypothetical membrane protein
MGRRLLLAAGIAVPFIYFANLIAAEAMTPGFNPGSQMPSELGLAGLPLAAVFNAGLIAVGVALVLAALGLFLGLAKLGANTALAAATGISLAMAGAAMAMAGLFPLPDPLHYGFNLLLGGILTPLLGAFALGAVRDTARERAVLFGAFAAIVGLRLAVSLVPGMADATTVGYWVRGFGLLWFSTLAYLCGAVMRRTL